MSTSRASQPRQSIRPVWPRRVAAGVLVLALAYAGVAAAPDDQPQVGLPECGPPPVLISPCPAVAPLAVAQSPGTPQRVFVIGHGFRPGARVSFPETGIDVRRTTFLDTDLLRVDIVVPASAGEGGAIIHVSNPGGRSSFCTSCGPTVIKAGVDPGRLEALGRAQVDWLVGRTSSRSSGRDQR